MEKVSVKVKKPVKEAKEVKVSRVAYDAIKHFTEIPVDSGIKTEQGVVWFARRPLWRLRIAQEVVVHDNPMLQKAVVASLEAWSQTPVVDVVYEKGGKWKIFVNGGGEYSIDEAEFVVVATGGMAPIPLSTVVARLCEYAEFPFC
jgi:hypothetical protein